MNRSLKTEISFLTLMGSLGLWLLNKPKLAGLTALGAATIPMLPATRTPFLNRTVIITGGSRGLGLALAEEFLSEGAKVALLCRDGAELERAEVFLRDRFISEDGIATPQLNIMTLTCDLTSAEETTFAIKTVAEQFGSIDVLVNNAGAISVGPFHTMEGADFTAQMNIHFVAPLRAIELCLPYLKQTKGKIVNISSIGGKFPVAHLSPYCASKFALAGLSETLAVELAEEGVQVTTVYPGLMRTGSSKQAVFKGDHEKEFAWFSIASSMPGVTIGAARAARQIVNATAEGRSQLVISVPAKILALGYSLFPETANWAMRWVARILPQGFSDVRQTGAASKGWLEEQKWSRPFRLIQETVGEQFNQKPKMDAEFNLGLVKAPNQA